MKNWTCLLAILCLAPLLVFTTGACGSGTTVVIPTGPGLFSGTYCLIVFAGSDGVPDEANTNWGSVTADGAGMITGGTISENENGVITGPFAQPPLPYAVDASRNLSIGAPPMFNGRISADGKVACLSAVTAGETPAIIILGRKEGVYSNASLVGLYHLTSFLYDPIGVDDIALWGSVIFDGLGGGMASLTENQNGVILGPGAGMMPHNVAADGSMTALFAGVSHSGAILAGGDLLILAGGVGGGTPPSILVLTKGTAGATNALFNGSYAFVGMAAEVAPPPEWISRLFMGTADGAGVLTVTSGTENADGVVTPLGALGAEAYSVGATGLFDLAFGNYFGGVTPSGDFAVAAGVNGAGGNPEIFFFLR